MRTDELPRLVFLTLSTRLELTLKMETLECALQGSSAFADAEYQRLLASPRLVPLTSPGVGAVRGQESDVPSGVL